MGRKKRRGRAKRQRKPYTLTEWRAVIVRRAEHDLARHGRVFALVALVLGRDAETGDMEQMACLCTMSGEPPEKRVNRVLLNDHTMFEWESMKRIRDEEDAKRGVVRPPVPRF